VLNVKFQEQEKWDCYLKLSNVSFIYPFEEFVVISEKPTDIKMKNMVLHNDTGMAVKYADGFGVYALNGVRMPEEIVMTRAENIDPKIALTETNADVQREIIRKIGAERVLKSCGAKELDNWDDPKTGYNYRLMDMTIRNNIRRKYLYFEHASMKGIFYAKPVPPEVNKALHGRAWILSLIERDKLKNISVSDEAELIANLPQYVS
jgi:hypothetical protein